ncbi:MAG: hypothetical protein E6K72_06675 [Candidatus Eisenbacteria bacterium]|uniref:Histidine ammonia-lyase n=1 Tax=Eiseniibacteriota bacterium TaxID=2212470 RepID=A0A538SV74_UNCEI|nr:MAG: hypothetical protein E6K72_06675 [Candidatus Eisenbacteria bacterium]
MARGPPHAGCARAARRRAPTPRAGGQGGAGAHQRHPALDRARLPRVRGSAAGVGIGDGGRIALDRGAAGFCAAGARGGADAEALPRCARGGAAHARVLGRQRARCLARRLRPGAGRVLAALRAAGDGRILGRDGPRCEPARDRDQLGERQPAGVRGRRRIHFGGPVPRPAGGAGGGLSQDRSCRLPPVLASDPGLESGYMLAQYTAAALVSENKVLSHPASVDSIPTGSGLEDHVSMAPIAARHARAVVENSARVVALELLCACRALEFRRPLTAGAGSERLYGAVRRLAPAPDGDRPIAESCETVARWVLSREPERLAEEVLAS